MRPSSTHHHHNDLMTTTPHSDLKSQGIVSSQTQRLAELTSRSSQGLMQWSSAAEHLESSVFCNRQPSSGRGIKGEHQPRQAELTSSSTSILRESQSSKLKREDYVIKQIARDSHQGRRSSLTMTIKSSKGVEACHRAEGHQLVIVLDYILLTNLPQDIGRRVSLNIRPPKPSSGDTSHLRAICPSIIVEHIVLVLGDEHLVLKIIIRSVITLLHQHQVWQEHPE